MKYILNSHVLYVLVFLCGEDGFDILLYFPRVGISCYFAYEY